MTAMTARIRATIRLLTPDHITPQGVRQLERVLNDEEAKADGEHACGEATR